MAMRRSLVTLLLFFKDTSATGTIGEELSTFLPPESSTDAFFGGSIAISNDVVIGSSYQDNGDGSVSIYEKGRLDTDPWPGTSIYAPEYAPVSGFGVSVAVVLSSEDNIYYAAVGAIYDNVNDDGIATGAVYIYTRKGSWWELSQRLSASDLEADDRFGSSLSMNGDRLVVGANYGDSKKGGVDTGRAFVFWRNSEGMYEPEQELKRSGETQNADDYYGYSVSLYGDVALIGAYGTDTGGENSGSVYVFVRDTSTGKWSQETALISGDTVAYDYFGYSVSMSGDYALIGAFGADSEDSGMQSGAAYLFLRNGKKGTWTLRQKLVSDDGSYEDQFAASVKLCNHGATALISARGDDDMGDNAGSVYLFNSNTHTVTLRQKGKMYASDASAGDWFGQSLSMDEYGAAAIGAPLKDENSGKAYMFKVPTGHVPKKTEHHDSTDLVTGLVILAVLVVLMISFIVLRSRGMLPDNMELAIMRVESKCSDTWRSMVPEKQEDFFAHTRTTTSTNDNGAGSSAEPYSPLDTTSSALV